MEKYQFPRIKDEIQFENFTRDLLNLIYKDNSFQLYGRKGQAQYGLDGYSTIHPIFFQCKHKSSPHVKDKKLEEELESEFNKAKLKIEEVSNPTESKFLFFTTHPNATKLQDKARVLSTNNIIVEYWGWETIESHLNNLYIYKHREFFSKYYPESAKILTTSKISPQLTTKLGKSTLIGRVKELQEIDELLKASKILLVKGIGGVGKSTIASNYLHRHKDEYDYYGFFEGLDSFESQLELTFKLEIEQAQDRLDRILRELIKLEPESNKLLVIDDVKDIKENQEKLEKILELEHHGYRVLLTSRFKVKNVEIYPLATLNPFDAQKLFLDNYKTQELEKVNQITEYLDYHPLFVELVAKTIENEDYTLDDMIEKFELGELAKIEFIDEEDGDEVSFNQNLKVLFEIQKDSLKDEYLLLLKQLAVLPSIDIELSFLEKIFDIKLKSRLNFLINKGWLINGFGSSSYKLHQIIKEYILSNYQPTFKEIEIVVDSFNALMKNSGANAQVAVDNQKNIIYFESLVTLLDRLEIENEKVGDFLGRFGNIYQHLGLYQKAESLYLKYLKISEKVRGEEHPSTATSYNNLAELYRIMGEYQKAEPLHLKVIKIFEKVLGEEHSDTVTSYNNLALLYWSMGEYQKAEPLYLKVVKIFEKVLGEEHSDTVTSYNNLALLYRSMGEYQKAEPLYLKALEISEKVLGEEHPSTATSYNNLATLYGSMGEYQKAEPLYLKALKIREKVLGEEHPNIARSYNNLATLYQGMSEYQKAIPLHIKALKIRKKVLKEEHPDIAESYNNLASLYGSMGEYKKAKPLYLKALEISEKVLGVEHPDTATSYNNLAVFYYGQGDFERAYEFTKRAVEVWSKVLPSNHPDLINSEEGLKMIEASLNQKSFNIIKPKRNNPCPCNSGKKYKKCCGKNS